MPVRRTKRGASRTPLGGDRDVLICGASFAGLALARELAGSGARVLVLDRYEIGERQTSACAAPTGWLEALGVEDSIRQTFQDLVIHTPHTSVRMELPWTFSTFDYRELCALLWDQCDAEFETATVAGREAKNTTGPAAPGGEAAGSAKNPAAPGRVARDAANPAAPGREAAGTTSPAAPGRVARDAANPAAPGREAEDAAGVIQIETDRGTLAAPLIADCLGWRRILDRGYAPPAAPLSRGLEVHPDGASDDLEIWIEREVVPAGYGWSFPAGDELRVGVGSFDPRHHVRQPTVALAERLELPSVRYQGNWIPHRLREATADGIFFCGDSAGHALPLTAEGIRTAFYFAIACGRELRRVVEGRSDRSTALRRYASFNARHRWQFESMLRVQRLIPRVPPRALALALRAMSADSFVRWSFGHYLAIAHPSFAGERASRRAEPTRLRAAA